MRPVVALRWVVFVVGLVAVAIVLTVVRFPPGSVTGVAGAADVVGEHGSAALGDAVKRTMAAGSVRVSARLVPADDGAIVQIDGVAATDGPELDIEARPVTAAGFPTGAPTLVRVTADRAWVRTPLSPNWTEVMVDDTVASGAASSWSDLIAGVLDATDVRFDGHEATFRLRGGRGTAWLDGNRRLARVRLEQPASTIDLRLSDYGVPLDIVAP